MPGSGKAVERNYTDVELAAFQEASLTPEQIAEQLGKTTYDIFLNEVGCWRNIPAKVWDYRIGGYQVIKKWLSYRELELLDRSLSVNEVREVRDMARRITVILLLGSELDANYLAVKQAVYIWPTEQSQEPVVAT